MVSSVYWEWDFLLHTVKIGVMIAACYDGLRITRIWIPHPSFLITIEDLVFWIFYTGLIFNMQLEQNNGVTRGFSILGILAGIVLYNRVIGERLVRFSGKFSHYLKERLTRLGQVFNIKLCKHTKVSLRKRRKNGKKKNQSPKEEAKPTGNDAGVNGSHTYDVNSFL